MTTSFKPAGFDSTFHSKSNENLQAKIGLIVTQIYKFIAELQSLKNRENSHPQTGLEVLQYGIR